MAKRKSSKKSSSSTNLGAIALVIVLLIGAAIVLGPEETLQLVGDVLGIDLGGADTGGSVGDTGGSGGSGSTLPPAPTLPAGTTAYEVYFTDPVIPFDDVTTGGLDEKAVELIDSATTSIDAAFFEFELESVRDALIRAHQRGVTVRIVHDNEHTEEDGMIEELEDAGIPAVPDERGAFMHNKFLVIDRNTVWMGSMNFTENGVYRNNNNVMIFRSTQLAENYSTEFNEMFVDHAFGPTSPDNTPNPVFNLNGIQIENYFASEGDVINPLLNLVASAQQSIHFMAFSFTRDDLGEAMVVRGQAGVTVQGIFEVRGADTEYSECPRMAAEGFDVRLDGNPRTFHHKVIIVDGETVATGSFNFSNNAVESNDENVVIVHDPAVAALYEHEFAARYAEAQIPALAGCELD